MLDFVRSVTAVGCQWLEQPFPICSIERRGTSPPAVPAPLRYGCCRDTCSVYDAKGASVLETGGGGGEGGRCLKHTVTGASEARAGHDDVEWNIKWGIAYVECFVRTEEC